MARRKKKKAWKKERDRSGGEARKPEPDPLLHRWPDAELDLHGRTVAEAEIATRNFLLTQSRLGSGRIVHVVTGKGTGRLFTTVESLLRDDPQGWVEEFAPDLQGAGFRIRVG